MDTQQRERILLAPYAMHAADSQGREHSEPPHPYRSPYQRDRDRIVHSGAYRRLAHKTQVFTGSLGDYHRTRLTHTHEVASVARTVARALRLNEDLTEALALLHDLGHPPFGHAGEKVLNDRLRYEGGFNHNSQALRIATKLERRYPDFPGLNLSLEVLASQAGRSRKAVVSASSPLLEAQVVDAADSLAYDAHDADDALELGVLTDGALSETTLWREATAAVQARFAALDGDQLRRATIHELLDRQVSDLITNTAAQLEEHRPASVEEVEQTRLLAQPSPEMAEKKLELERLLFDRVYRHPKVLEHRREAIAALETLLDQLIDAPLPAPFDAVAEEESTPRAAADYVASFTDRYALVAARSNRPLEKAGWAVDPV